MNKLLTIIIGLILFIAPLYAGITNFIGFGNSALVVLKGGIIWGVLFTGAIVLFSGISSLKED